MSNKKQPSVENLENRVRILERRVAELEAIERHAIAGFVRNCLEGDTRFTGLYEQARKRGVIRELK